MLTLRPRPAPLRGFVPISLAFVAFSLLGHQLANHFLTSDGASVWYPPAALTFVYLIRVGRKGLPVVVVTRLLAVQLIMGVPFRLGSSLVTTGLIVGSYFVAAEWCRPRLERAPTHLRQVFTLAVAVMGAAFGAAVLGMGFATLVAHDGTSRLGQTILTFWLGDVTAGLSIAPAMLLGGHRPDPLVAPPRRSRAEILGQTIAVILAAWVVVIPGSEHPQFYPTFVPLAWVAVRGGLGPATRVMAAMGLLVPLFLFTNDASANTMMAVEIFTVLYCFTGLLLGATESDRRRSEGGLIAARREIEQDHEALQEAEQRFRSAFEMAPFGVELASAAAVLDVNPKLVEITGRSREELLGAGGVSQHLHPDDRVRLAQERILSEERGDPYFSTETRIVRPDGSERWVRGTILPVEQGTSQITRIIHIEDITETRAAQAALTMSQAEFEWQALHDPLTGLPNRTMLLDRLSQSLATAHDERRRPALLYMDVDRFKTVNDTLGHHAGDQLLSEVARRLEGLVRSSDMVARLGGDEFVVLLDHVRRDADATELADRINRDLIRPIEIDTTSITLSVSVGIAYDEGHTAENLLRDADSALYLAKDRGKNRFMVFDDSMRASALQRLAVEQVLRRALDDGQLVVHYQPIVDLTTGQVINAEALLRVPGPNGELQSPAEFIAIAEDCGLIVPIGAGVLDAACHTLRQWRLEEPPGPRRVSVNVSPRQLSTPGFAQMVARALRTHDLEPSALVLEFTESALIHADSATTATVTELHELGVSLAIDDFGTGYGSLSYLKRFPIDAVKIDASFVDGLGRDPSDTEIVRAVTSLGRSLGLVVVAEGIETDHQLEQLRALGCDAGQGYLLGRPGPAERVMAQGRATSERVAEIAERAASLTD